MPGELARNANVKQAQFSVARWVFWRKRFKEIERCSDGQVAEEAKHGFRLMVRRGREMGFQIDGEAEYEARIIKYLEVEFEKARHGVVTPEGMSIHSDSE